MPTQIITGDNANEATFSGASDGTFALRVGPNGAKVTGLAAGATGNVDVLGQLTQQNGMVVPRMQLFSAKATTSGTAIDFSPADGTAIPSWAKKITIILSGVSTTGVSPLLFQYGTVSGIENTGYLASGTISDSASTTTTSTAGIPIRSIVAAGTAQVVATVANVSGNTWIAGYSGNISGTSSAIGGGSKTLTGGTIDRIRLTTVNGTDTFDAGSISILVEGY